MCYILENMAVCVPHLVFRSTGVLLLGDLFLFNTVLQNVNQNNFCIQEGWQSRYYICYDCLIFFSLK